MIAYFRSSLTGVIMGLDRYRTRSHVGAIVQLLAIVVLQSYFWAPVYRQMFLSKGTVKQCHRDHQMCGCSPERVATKTCCCLRVVPSCCLSEHKQEGDITVQSREASPIQKISNSPCGSETFSAAISLDKLKFVFPDCFILSSQKPSANSFPILTVEVPERFLEPPDPPPRLSIFS